MAQALNCLTTISDDELLSRVRVLASDECRATARLIEALAELDRRKLYLAQGCSSLFTYCTQVLHLSEHAAYSRIESARAARKFPAILNALQNGAITLTAVCLLAPLLTDQNHGQLIADSRHRSKRDIEDLVARMRPKADVATSVRKLPVPGREEAVTAPIWSSAGTACAESATQQTDGQVPRALPVDAARPAVVVPLAPERYKIQFTASRETYEKLRRAQDLLRHAIPNGDPAAVFDRALTVLLTVLMNTKMAATQRPRRSGPPQPGSRHIPAAVRREVWRRDGARCAFVGPQGRCAERGFLELHHIVPFASGGAATVANIALRCRAHNAYEAELDFGSFVLREREEAYNSVRTEPGRWHEIGARYPCASSTRRAIRCLDHGDEMALARVRG
jgi:hypothetical protein